MAVLNFADRIYLNGQEVDRVYLDGVQVYPDFIPEIKAVISRANAEGFSIPNNSTLWALNGLIKRTKINGNLWNSRDVFKIYPYSDTSLDMFSRIDLKDAYKPLISIHGGMSYTNNGWKGNGVDGFIDTKFNPSLAAKLTIDDMGIFHILDDDYSPISGAFVGIQQSAPNRRIGCFPLHDSIGAATYANDFTFNNKTGAFDKKRFLGFGRNDGTKYTLKNSEKTNFAVPPVVPICDINYYSGATNVNGTANFFADGTEIMFSAGSSITAAEAAQFIIDINIFFSEIGQTPIVL